jgi:hypothetical protein
MKSPKRTDTEIKRNQQKLTIRKHQQRLRRNKSLIKPIIRRSSMAGMSEQNAGATPECRLLQHRFKDYMCAEVASMVEEMGDVLPEDPEELNRMVMEWISKNAAQFRAKWVENQLSQNPAN